LSITVAVVAIVLQLKLLLPLLLPLRPHRLLIPDPYSLTPAFSCQAPQPTENAESPITTRLSAAKEMCRKDTLNPLQLKQ
jgi:hypothetical protein